MILYGSHGDKAVGLHNEGWRLLAEGEGLALCLAAILNWTPRAQPEASCGQDGEI